MSKKKTTDATAEIISTDSHAPAVVAYTEESAIDPLTGLLPEQEILKEADKSQGLDGLNQYAEPQPLSATQEAEKDLSDFDFDTPAGLLEFLKDFGGQAAEKIAAVLAANKYCKETAALSAAAATLSNLQKQMDYFHQVVRPRKFNNAEQSAATDNPFIGLGVKLPARPAPATEESVFAPAPLVIADSNSTEEGEND